MMLQRRFVIALAIALCLVLVVPNSASAQSLQDYFSFSYDVQFSKNQIQGSELFEATIKGEATCTKDLPVSASQASITGRVIAKHQASGTRLTLNSGYTLTIDPFPSKKGQTTQAEIVVPLRFPQGSQSGTYSIIAELIEAKVKAIIWIDVTRFLPSSQTGGSITYLASSSGGGGGGGGGGGVAPSPPEKKVNLSGLTSTTSLRVDSSGMVQEASRLQYLGSKAYLDIARGTTLLDAHGIALTSLSATESGALPVPSLGTAIVSAVDFGPDGASFKPAITLTMSYAPESLAVGMSEDELYIAYWDSSQWQALPTVLDTEANTVSAQINHFTQFAITGKLTTLQTTTTPPPTSTPPAPTVEPPRFTILALSVTPAEVEPAQKVTVSVMVTNTGGSRGQYTVVLKVNAIEESGKQLIFDAGASQMVTFAVVKNTAGRYEVDVNGLVGSFVVKEATLASVEPSSEVPSAIAPLKFFNWWLIGGVIAGLLLLGLVSFFIARKRG